MFDIIKVPEDAANSSEQLGTKFKYWYRREDGSSYLYKEGRPETGENWAEKIASELCELLGLPHAEYELATWRGRKGVICKNFVPDGGRLVHGNELLVDIDTSYPISKFYGVKQHTIPQLSKIMNSESLMPPIGWRSVTDICNAMDIFIGYLMLDVLISNQDRHHENWGIIYFVKEDKSYLAPTYDHASSLGRNESDKRRKEILLSHDNRRNLDHYVSKAASTFYARNQQKRLSTMDALINAGNERPNALMAWLKKLKAIRKLQMTDLIDQIPKPEISDVAAEFALSMLIVNKRRLMVEGGL